MKTLSLSFIILICTYHSSAQGFKYIRFLNHKNEVIDSGIITFGDDANGYKEVGQYITDTNGLVKVPLPMSQYGLVNVQDGPQKKYRSNQWRSRIYPKEYSRDTLIFPNDFNIKSVFSRAYVVRFPARSVEITKDAEAVLHELVAQFSLYPDYPVEVMGHADISENEIGDSIAMARAIAIEKWLSKNGISKGRLSTTSHGTRDELGISLNSNTDDPFFESRRVEFYWIDKNDPNKKIRLEYLTK